MRTMIRLILFTLLLSSCVHLTPQDRRSKTIENCVHNFVDKGIRFIEASYECAERIHPEYDRTGGPNDIDTTSTD